MSKDIFNYNSKGQYHGYQEWYCEGKVWFRGNAKTGNWDGYRELYRSSGKIGELTFHIQ